VHDIPTVAEVIERIVQEAKEAGKNVNAMLN